jgi:hypothetical protein
VSAPDLLQLRIIWDRAAIALPFSMRFHSLHVAPEPGYPFGRKGLQLATAWKHLAAPHTAGMLVADGDVAFDHQDLNDMYQAINLDASCVWTAPIKLWPVSTKRTRWVWSHLLEWPDEQAQVDNRGDTDPDFTFSFCFTYMPRRLIDAVIGRGQLRTVQYPHVDQTCMEWARKLSVPVRIVRGHCSPKHMNY